jgi:hypothetical protein
MVKKNLWSKKGCEFEEPCVGIVTDSVPVAGAEFLLPLSVDRNWCSSLDA